MGIKRTIQRKQQKNQKGITLQSEKAIYEQGFLNGCENEYTLMKPFYESRESLHCAIMVIAAASMCSHGDQTKQVLLDAKNKLYSELSHFENMVYNIGKFRTITIPTELWDEIAELRARLSKYANYPTRENQDKIRQHIGNVTLGFESIIKIDPDPRGRKPDNLKLAIGRYALNYGEPEARKTYIQGEKLYADLNSIPKELRTKEQEEMIVFLGDYMAQGEQYALDYKRRDLGVFIQEARALAIKSGN